MKKKIIYILLTVLFIFYVVPTSGMFIYDGDYNFEKYSNDPPLPGCMDSDELFLFNEYYPPLNINNPPKFQKNSNENIISLIQQLNETLYLDYLENLVFFGPRETTSQACEDAGQYIYDEFQAMGLDARIQEWSSGDLFGTNIEATINGVNQSNDEIYIICAHYDSVPGSPGADDDGSGTAAVLSAAKVMSESSFNHTVKFVTFSGEEQGLYGSYYYVQEAVNNSDNIVAVLNADMIGFALSTNDKSKLRVFEDEYSTWLTDFTYDIGQEYFDLFELEIIPSGYSWGSDHYRFWQAGYNAIFYAEYNFNDYYHSPQDIIENMNISYATRSSKLLTATLAELSEITNEREPFKPETPNGITNGIAGDEYYYTTSTIDINGDDVFYFWNWGDGSNSGWIGPYLSGEIINVSHSWESKGDYVITVKAKDENDLESEWSDPLSISMPKPKIFGLSLFLEFLEKVFLKINFLKN
jgi:hypothetical protein